jgi:hypothetical protein
MLGYVDEKKFYFLFFYLKKKKTEVQTQRKEMLANIS